MPTAPKKIKRQWQPERVKQQRTIDMSWFYNSWTWRKFSRRFKNKQPLCCMCEAKGIVTATTVTDHIERFVVGGPGFNLKDLKEEYFQPLCDYHHNQKSGKEAHGFKQKK